MTSQGPPEAGAWKTVPVEPTDAMLEEADFARALPESYIREVYAAMLAASPSPPPGVGDETGWVIERGDSKTDAPTYWAGIDMWSQDHMDAVRFARKIDAERTANREHRWHGLAHRVCEHIWVGA